MKQINTYINEKLRLTNKRTYTCQPKTFHGLRSIIIDRINDEGNECDLNDIDISKITHMSFLFDAGTFLGNKIFEDFNGDISQWDVSNVEDMSYMFCGCKKFNCDLSMWNVSKAESMYYMFNSCRKFNQDLDSWDVRNVKNMKDAFKYCPTQPTWYDKDKWESV